MSFRNRALSAIEHSWWLRRFSRNLWILNTTNFLFILHDSFFSWMGKTVLLYLPEEMIVLYYNRKTKKFRLYVKNKITIKMLDALCIALKCAKPSFKAHGLYLESFDDPDLTNFKKTPEGEIYFQELKCGENCVIYNGEYYLIEIVNFYSYNFGMLDLSKKGIRDISEIKGLDSLRILGVLDLSDNKITELKCLENLKNLYDLNISNNRLTEIKGLESLTRLRYLNLKNNLITEIKGLENFLIDRTGEDMKIILGDNRIPIDLLQQIGGLNKDGYANDPVKIVDYCIRKERERKKFDKSSILKLKKILRVSNRFRLDMLMDILDIDKENLYSYVEKWSVDFGFEINGNYLIIKKDTVLEFIDELDKQFNEWENTNMKNGKKIII